MSEVPAKPVQPPDHQNIEPALPGVGDELVQCRAAVLRAGHAPVDKIDRAPVARGGVAAQFEKLVFAGLVCRADSRIDRGADAVRSVGDHGLSLVQGGRWRAVELEAASSAGNAVDWVRVGSQVTLWLGPLS